MIRAIIVDDEVHACRILRSLLEEFMTGIKVVGEANSVDEAEKLIRKSTFDLLFLDVEMPGGNGFSLLDRFESIEFELVFTTAFSQYAIEALRQSALDYLLKPIDLSQLQDTIERFKSRRKAAGDEQVYFLPLDLNHSIRQSQKIILPVPKGFRVVSLSEIIFCKSSGNYTDFILQNGSHILVAKTLKYFEEYLSHVDMMRIHDSYLVNLFHVEQYERGRGGAVILSNGEQLTVARGRKDKLLKWFSSTRK